MTRKQDRKTGKLGRPRSFDRNEALGQAIELFWRHGYEGVSIATLADAMGVAPPSLYAAFRSKADLFREAVARYGDAAGMFEPFPADFDAYNTVKGILERGVGVVTQPGRPKGCMVSIGMLASGPQHAGLARELRQLRTSFREAIQSRVQQDINAGVLPASTNASELAHFYAAVSQGIAVQASDGASADELSGVVEAALRAWPASS